LGRKKDISSVDPLIAVLNDSDALVKVRAAEALGEIGSKRAEQPLIKLLCDQNVVVRKAAISSLGKLKSKTAVPALLEMLRDKDNSVRETAVIVLGNIGDDRALQAILDCLKDMSTSVKDAAIVSLGNYKDQRAIIALVNELKTEWGGEHSKAGKSLVKIGKQAVPQMIELLKSSKSDGVQSRVCYALEQINKPSVEPLIQIIHMQHDKNPGARRHAIETLAKIKDTRAINPLVQALIDDPYNSTIVIEALGSFGEPAVDILLTRVSSTNIMTRGNVLDALGRTKSKRALKYLLPALGDPDSYIRTKAAGALGNLQYAEAVKPLIKLLKDKFKAVRLAAIIALERIGSKKAVPQLIEALDDDDTEVKEHAYRSLKALTKNDFGPAAEEWRKNWKPDMSNVMQ
jgi:HEAT repeat protein